MPIKVGTGPVPYRVKAIFTEKSDNKRQWEGFMLSLITNTPCNNFPRIAYLYHTSIEKIRIMELLLHSADLSNCVKPWAVHSKSAGLLLEEFFRQVF